MLGKLLEFLEMPSNHFHNGVDIGEPDGYPIYSSLSGVVHSLQTSSEAGTSAFVRVRTHVGGMWKHMSYVHIEPNPALAPGAVVIAGETILGTVLSGLGHVHLTEREFVSSETASGVEINALRESGGLAPFFDAFPPVINRNSLQFRQSGTVNTVSAQALFQRIDIIVKVDERNEPGPVGGVRTNNGTYMLGYRIWTADTTGVVYQPPDDGLRLRFDRKPVDSDVGKIFLESLSSTTAHYYIVTNGSGASAINTTRTVSTNAFDTELLPEGNYILHIFTEDTRGNRDSAYFPIGITRRDLTPPSLPTSKAALVDSAGGLQISWYANKEADLQGYRLYYKQTGGWKLAAQESVLTKAKTSIAFLAPLKFAQEPEEPFLRLAFKLMAVDTAGNESQPSDVYFAANAQWNLPTQLRYFRVLIIDGFDRYGGSGSWKDPTHAFVVLHGEAFPVEAVVSSCANEAIMDGSVKLTNYDAVLWVSGDESTLDRTFTSSEQAIVKEFLERGGRLFVSGSEIGWDLGRAHSRSESGDLAFYNNYLKANFVFDGTSSMNTAAGVAGRLFEGLTVQFGQTYPEDYPDDIDPVGGSVTVLTYNAVRGDGGPRNAGLAYKGTFGSSTTEGTLVYLAFPFETITSLERRRDLMTRVIRFFDVVTSVAGQSAQTAIPGAWSLSQNYPNPFNPATTFEITVPNRGVVTLRMYDVLGREIETLLHEDKHPGVYRVMWNAARLSSGTYLARLQADAFSQTRHVVLLK